MWCSFATRNIGSGYIYYLDFALVPGSGEEEPKLDQAIESFINWLSNIVNQCEMRQGNLSQPIQIYPVAANLLRIAKRIRLLESFYEEALDMCSF